MDYITVFFDITAFLVIIIAGLFGASGCRFSSLTGLIIGLFAGTIFIAINQIVAQTLYSGLHFHPEKSYVIQPLSNLVLKIFKIIYLK